MEVVALAQRLHRFDRLYAVGAVTEGTGASLTLGRLTAACPFEHRSTAEDESRFLRPFQSQQLADDAPARKWDLLCGLRHVQPVESVTLAAI